MTTYNDNRADFLLPHTITIKLHLLYTMTIELNASSYGVATVSRIDKITGLFCRISSLLYGSFAKETYNLIDPTNQSHLLPELRNAATTKSTVNFDLRRTLLGFFPACPRWRIPHAGTTKFTTNYDYMADSRASPGACFGHVFECLRWRFPTLTLLKLTTHAHQPCYVLVLTQTMSILDMIKKWPKQTISRFTVASTENPHIFPEKMVYFGPEIMSKMDTICSKTKI